MTRTAVVTGLGITAPNGLGTETYWRRTLAGESGLGQVSLFDATQYPATVAGEILDYVAEDRIPSRLLPQTDRMTRFALTAAEWALTDAGFDPAGAPEYGTGVVTAASGGAIEFGQRELQNLWAKGKEYVSAYQSFAWFYAVNSGQISIRHKLRGAGGVLLTEQAGGLDALGQARRHVRKGLQSVLSGGVDGPLSPWGWVPHLTSGLMSTEKHPCLAYLPFSSAATGHVLGEGGAMLFVEDAETAHHRGARSYGEIAGYAASLDPAPGTGSPLLARTAAGAIADAGLSPGDIDVVFADAAGNPALDQIESSALLTLFGPRGVPVTAPKTMTGRLLAGGGALDVATALLALRDNVIPPTINVTAPASEHQIDLITKNPREAELRSALVIARGHDGFNAALVVRAPQ